ncbi:hypothetical protein AgCh_018581 [Apium graveolens]
MDDQGRTAKEGRPRKWVFAGKVRASPNLGKVTAHPNLGRVKASTDLGQRRAQTLDKVRASPNLGRVRASQNLGKVRAIQNPWTGQDNPLSLNKYPIEELLLVMQPQEGGVRGQRPPGVCLDGRPPPVVNEYPHWGCGLNFGAAYPGDRDASNIWGEPRLYPRPRTRETAGSEGLSLAREMPYP